MSDNLAALGIKAMRPSDETVSETSVEDLPFDPPVELRNLLKTYKGFIAFDRWVVFKPDEPSGFEDERGALHLTGIYGLFKGLHGLSYAIEMYQSQLPPNFFPIADSHGDQICFNQITGQIFFWKHDSVSEPTLVADSFDQFINSLEIHEPEESDFDLSQIKVSPNSPELQAKIDAYKKKKGW